MAYQQTTQKALKALVRNGSAWDATNYQPEDLPQNYDILQVSRGIYGMNGCLVADRDSGDWYVITARNSNLFRLV